MQALRFKYINTETIQEFLKKIMTFYPQSYFKQEATDSYDLQKFLLILISC